MTTASALGMISGWSGGQIDEILLRIVDFMMATPFILVALVLVIVFGPSVELIIMLLIVFSWDSFGRQIRGETLQLKTRDSIAAAQISGASTYRILFKHLLPGVVNTVLVIMSLRVGNLIITESILSYLGVGIPPPTPAWGLMIANGRELLVTSWWVAAWPGVAILLSVLSMNLLGAWLRDRLDPKLRNV